MIAQDMRTHAVYIVSEYGLPVFPVRSDSKKPPIYRNWYGVSSCDPLRVYELWTCPVSGDSLPYNIAVDCTNLLTLDADVKNNKPGLISLQKLIDQRGLDPNTLTHLTPTSGRHLLYRLPEGIHVRNSESELAPGLDVRGYHGYVLAPGSTVGGQPYTWLLKTPLLTAPDWLIAACGSPRKGNGADGVLIPSAARYAPLVDPDQPSAIAAATYWLEQSAPEAVEGNGGDTTTYQVACGVKDFGVSESMCAELMLDHWNETKALPPWAPEELEWKVGNAYRYGVRPVGVNSAEAEFEAVKVDEGARFGRTEAKLAPLRWADVASWDTAPLPRRPWAVKDRVPLRQVGLFSGEGGTGKSLSELVKDGAHVLGRDWLGAECRQGPIFYLGAEDEEDELHIRLGAVAEYYGVTFSQLAAAGLHVMSLLGTDATLCFANPRTGKVETTALYKMLFEAAGDIKPVNISLDTLSRVFAGSEIDRVQVYAFANHMQALAQVANGSVTVLSHPSLQGMASGSGLSGSTAWHGAFRFRQYLRSATTNGDSDNGLRELVFKKNQYGPQGEKIILRYQNGLFLPDPEPTDLETAERELEAEASVLDRIDMDQMNLSTNPHSVNYAPRIFTRMAGAKWTEKDYEGAMHRLLAAGKIRVEKYGRPAEPRYRIVSTKE